MEEEFRRQFEATGYLSPCMADVTEVFRERMSDWFTLVDDISSALQRCAMRNMEAVATGSNSFEQKTVAHLVLLRGVGTFQAAILTAERGMVAETRMLARSVLEDAFCVAALHDNPVEFLEHLKTDDALAKKGQANAILSFGDAAKFDEEKLRQFVSTIPKLKNLGTAGVAKLGPLAQQYLAYRVLSNDGAHPSATSLQRHMAFNENRSAWTGFKIGPAKDADIVESLNFAALAALPIGIGYTVIVGDTEGNAELGKLSARYQSLPDTRAKLAP